MQRAVLREQRLQALQRALAPGETAAVTLTAKLDRPGLRIVTAAVGPDELDADNRMAVVQPGVVTGRLHAAALERGYSPATVLSQLDAPITGYEGRWLPRGDHEAATYTLRRALQVSSNRAAAQLLQQIGTSSAIDISRRLGILSELPPVPSLALGTGGLTQTAGLTEVDAGTTLALANKAVVRFQEMNRREALTLIATQVFSADSFIARRAGADAHVSKPIVASELRAALSPVPVAAVGSEEE